MLRHLAFHPLLPEKNRVSNHLQMQGRGFVCCKVTSSGLSLVPTYTSEYNTATGRTSIRIMLQRHTCEPWWI